MFPSRRRTLARAAFQLPPLSSGREAPEPCAISYPVGDARQVVVVRDAGAAAPPFGRGRRSRRLHR
jgi:hypothetical protein